MIKMFIGVFHTIVYNPITNSLKFYDHEFGIYMQQKAKPRNLENIY